MFTKLREEVARLLRENGIAPVKTEIARIFEELIKDRRNPTSVAIPGNIYPVAIPDDDLRGFSQGVIIINPNNYAIVEGYASTYDVDTEGTQVGRGAFTESIKDLKSADMAIPLFLEHNYDIRLGVIKGSDITEDSRGLKIKAMIDLDTEAGSFIYKMMEHHGVRGMSFGGLASKKAIMNGVNYLMEVDLLEVSLTNDPKNTNSIITRFYKGK